MSLKIVIFRPVKNAVGWDGAGEGGFVVMS